MLERKENKYTQSKELQFVEGARFRYGKNSLQKRVLVNRWTVDTILEINLLDMMWEEIHLSILISRFSRPVRSVIEDDTKF